MSDSGTDRPDWDRVQRLLDVLYELPKSQHRAYLESACPDPSIRREVLDLLAAEEVSNGYFRRLAQKMGLAANGIQSPDLSGSQIGPWRIKGELGRGGMAVVYSAERADGEFTRQAAVKVLKLGLDTEEVVRRFEQERQILADLDHPAIARLLDGGHTEDGRPYLVMELAQGLSVDRYCDRRRLSTEHRLRLFLEVARAVRHAHQQLVVHRDLKPSNIVVTADGELKLLDFGIAKILDPAASTGGLTRTRMQFLTPEYASPEQIKGETVTTASDVYQLGVLLYQLLSGRRPYDLSDLSPAAAERVICKQDPAAPSTLVRRAPIGDRSAREMAERRRSTPERLRKRLRGDLDAIVLTALAKDPGRRYGSVDQLIVDLERHLEGRPVAARQPTVVYRAGKFLHRHPLGTSAAAAFALLLVAYAATVTYQAGRLARERDHVRVEATKVERVRDFLIGLFAAADPYGEQGKAVTAGELVAAGAEQIRSELDEEPEIRAELVGVLGDVLMALNEFESAEELVSEALALQRRVHAEDHPDLARAVARYAALLLDNEDWEAAERFAREALEMRARLQDEDFEAVAESLRQVAGILVFQARYREAEELYRQALALRHRYGLARDGPAAALWNDLGTTLFKAGRLADAEAAHRKALAIRRQLLASDHPDVSESLNDLALALSAQGRFTEAESLYTQALEIRRRVFGDDHLRVANTLHLLGNLLRRAGKLDEAAENHGEALAIQHNVLGNRNLHVAMSLHALAEIADDRGASEKAEQLYVEALSMFRELPEDHPRIAGTAVALGWLLLREGRVQEAAPLLEEGLKIRVAALGRDSDHTAEARVALGLCRAAQGRMVEARSLLEPGLPRLRDSAVADPDMIAEAIRALAALPRDQSGLRGNRMERLVEPGDEPVRLALTTPKATALARE